MNLDLFNKLINNAKDNNIIQNFIKELGDYLRNNLANNLEYPSRNQISLFNQIQKENNVTSEYRDKMLISRSNLLQNYAKETADKGTMYYIYDKSANNYLVSICEEKRSHEIIKLSESDLPQGACIDSVLRLRHNNYILDQKATEHMKKEMLESFNQLLEEQSNKMDERRVEGHIYEFIEGTDKSIWLIDTTAHSNKGFEEFEFQSEVFDNAKEGDLFKYINATYQKCS